VGKETLRMVKPHRESQPVSLPCARPDSGGWPTNGATRSPNYRGKFFSSMRERLPPVLFLNEDRSDQELQMFRVPATRPAAEIQPWTRETVIRKAFARRAVRRNIRRKRNGPRPLPGATFSTVAGDRLTLKPQTTHHQINRFRKQFRGKKGKSLKPLLASMQEEKKK